MKNRDLRIDVSGLAISSAAELMVKNARDHRKIVRSNLNGVDLFASPSLDPYLEKRFLMARYYFEKDLHENPRTASFDKTFQDQMQLQVEAAMLNLHTLDFSDPRAVLDWFLQIFSPCHYQDAYGIVIPIHDILKAFAKQGFVPKDEDCPEMKPGKKTKQILRRDAHWLVERVLYFLKTVGTIDSPFVSCIAAWHHEYDSMKGDEK